jgi:uncharacterized membrane protein YfcA
MVELIFIGIIVGFMSGFFGIGGGTIVVPVLLLLGYDTKEAIGIAVIQMAFSSIFGSYLNNKKGSLDVPMIASIGVGGFTGALVSGYVTSNLDAKTLEIVFLAFVLFAFIRMSMKIVEDRVQRSVNKTVLFLLGFIIGTISMSVGLGGAFLLIPILVGFLHVEIKKAISAGLFFVVFSSIAGVISHGLSKHIDFESGTVIGLASLIGVYFGILLKDKIDSVLQKRLLAGFYLLIVIYLINRIFINE